MVKESFIIATVLRQRLIRKGALGRPPVARTTKPVRPVSLVRTGYAR
jgi:hypothetical protein